MLETPDLYAFVIRLRPERGGPPLDAQGHQAQALFLDLVRQVDPELSQALHAHALSKPFTVAVLDRAARQSAVGGTVTASHLQSQPDGANTERSPRPQSTCG